VERTTTKKVSRKRARTIDGVKEWSGREAEEVVGKKFIGENQKTHKGIKIGLLKAHGGGGGWVGGGGVGGGGGNSI